MRVGGRTVVLVVIVLVASAAVMLGVRAYGFEDDLTNACLANPANAARAEARGETHAAYCGCYARVISDEFTLTEHFFGGSEERRGEIITLADATCG